MQTESSLLDHFTETFKGEVSSEDFQNWLIKDAQVRQQLLKAQEL